MTRTLEAVKSTTLAAAIFLLPTLAGCALLEVMGL